jgi:hypothetical protein
MKIKATPRWGKNEFGQKRRRLMLGGLYIGEIHYFKDYFPTPWRAWFSTESEGSKIGLYPTAADARRAVNDTFFKSVEK